MTREQHLLTILAEECGEVVQRASKAIRFGLDESQPGQLMIDMLGLTPDAERRAAKPERVEHYMERSRDRGQL
jgi:hypothetical protein